MNDPVSITPAPRIRVDISRVYGGWLCLTHGKPCLDETGAGVPLRAGMTVTVFEEETDENGKPDELIATGTVEPSPDWTLCKGSKWALHIDTRGVRRAADSKGKLARKVEAYDAVTTASEELVRIHREAMEKEDDDDSDASFTVVSYRGGRTEFDLGQKYALSDDPMDRTAGADVLSQLGWGEDCFHDESVEILLRLVTDTDPRVIAAAAIALGHRRSARGIPLLLPLLHHEEARVRLAVVFGLATQADPAAIDALITLTRDADRDVRDWSAFNLGSILEVDLKEIRDALVPLLEETDAEIRGEALIGLAKRHDPRALAPLIRELSGEFEGSWCLEAATFMADPTLVPPLIRLRGSLTPEDEGCFGEEFEKTIAVCRQPPKICDGACRTHGTAV